nr:ATP synthase F0 subunit 8 [Tsivoka simplicicollis]
MPQMAPLNWLTLFLFFSFTFLIFNSMNYFGILYTTKKDKIKKMKTSYNWKW